MSAACAFDETASNAVPTHNASFLIVRSFGQPPSSRPLLRRVRISCGNSHKRFRNRITVVHAGSRRIDERMGSAPNGGNALLPSRVLV
jgi:hypothetical protein